MSRHTENKEEILKIHGTIDLINQRLDTLEHNHLAHMQKDIDRIQKVVRFISKSKLERIIRSTRVGNYNPYIVLHGYKFELKINS